MAVLAAEDQKFLDHNGFDYEAINEAWQKNQHSQKVRGASTISQQVAKNLYLWPGKSFFRKRFGSLFYTFNRNSLAKTTHYGGLPEHCRIWIWYLWG